MSKEATATALRVNAITGIIVPYLNKEQMAGAAKEVGITLPGEPEASAMNLYAYYLKGVGGDSGKLLECQDCLGRSPEALKACPYCRGKVTATTGSEAGKPSTPKKEATKTMETTATGKKAAQTALALVGSAAISAKHSEKDLDRAVREVAELKMQSAMGMWQLGRKIAEIRDNQLWKLRNGDGGKPRYKTAEAFITAELGMSVTHAWNLAKVSKEFEEKAVAKFGTQKLGLILQAPPEARPALQAQVEAGASKGKIAKAVKDANKGRATLTTNAGKEVKNPGIAKAAKQEAEGRKTISVANILGSQTMKLYKKATVQGEDKKEWGRAKRIADVPYCTMQLENDVVQKFTILEGPDGALQLKIVTERN